MKLKMGKRFAARGGQTAGGQNGQAMPHPGDVPVGKTSVGFAERFASFRRKPSRYLILLSAVSLAFGLPVLRAQAGSSSTTFQVSMTVTQNCKITTSGNFNFGNYDPVVANALAPLQVTTPGFISVNCNKNTTSVWVGLDTGTNSSHAPTGSTRAVSDGNGDYIGYDFYQDSAFTTVWGNTSATAPTLGPFTSAKTPVTANVYGQAPAGQDVPAGTYTDTITATVNF